MNDRRVIWERPTPDGRTACVMISCCAGAELQIVRSHGGDEEILLRELYPDRSTLYERAQELSEYTIERLIGWLDLKIVVRSTKGESDNTLTLQPSDNLPIVRN